MKRRDFLKSTAILTCVPAVGSELSPTKSEAAPPPALKVAGWVDERPRLYFDRQAIANLRGRVETDAAIKQRWAKVLARATRLLDVEMIPEEMVRQGENQHGGYLSLAQRFEALCMTLSLAYQVTGDRRFGDQLKRALLHYGSFQQWYGPGYIDRDPAWRSELSTAAFCSAYAIGYDAIYDLLSAEERRSVADAVIRLGILPTLEDWVLPERRIHALDSMGHNWWSVCVSMAGVAALSLLGDDPRVPGWIEQVSHGLEQWFAYHGNVLQNKHANFDPRGGFNESVSYADYAIRPYLLFRLAFGHVLPHSPQPRIPVLERLGDFFLHTFYPASAMSLAVNFGDHGTRWRPDRNAGQTPEGGAAELRVRERFGRAFDERDPGRDYVERSVRLLLANGLGGEAVRWYVRRADPDSPDVMSLLYPATAGPDAPPALPCSVIYPDTGWAMLRSSWKDDATLLAVKSGFTWNHSHADAGSFILFHAGEPLIIDSGTCSYNRPERGDYYTQSRAHNVVLFNGQGQPKDDAARGCKFSGRVHSLVDALGLKYVYADATGPMARYLTRNYRHWLWLDDAILIFDDLRAHEEGRFDWLLHYAGTAQHEAGNVSITNGPAKATVRFLFPESLDVREVEGLAERNPDEKATYLSFSPKKASLEQKFIAAVLPAVAGRPAPELELLQGREMLGVRLRHGDATTEVYLNLRADGRRMHLNCNNVIDGWETDAYLLALTRPAVSQAATPDTVSRYFLSAGSYLRKGGQVVVDSLSQVTGVFRPGRQMEAWIEGQQMLDAALYCPEKPERLLLNGQPAQFSYAPVERAVRAGSAAKK